MHNLGPILLIEDDRVDVMTVRRALKERGIHNELLAVADGQQALDYLRDTRNRLPALIVTDLYTPRLKATEFLGIIKAEPRLKGIPVVAISSSAEPDDIAQVLELGAVMYVVKSLDYERFALALGMAVEFLQRGVQSLATN